MKQLDELKKALEGKRLISGAVAAIEHKLMQCARIADNPANIKPVKDPVKPKGK